MPRGASLPSHAGYLRLGKMLVLAVLLVGSLSAETYYIDCVQGQDTNTGRSTSEAWRRHPYMQGWTGRYSHKPGDRFVFRGGVVCPANAFMMKIIEGGTVRQPDYYGADLEWYSGEAWSRPVFDLEGRTPVAGTAAIVVSASHVTFAQLEIRNLFIEEGATWQASSISIVYQRGILIKDCYIHDWTTNSRTDDQMGGVTAVGSPDITVERSTIHGTLAGGGRTSGSCTFNIATVRFSHLYHCSNGVFGSSIVHDNEIHHIGQSVDPSYHENALEVGGAPLVKVYNNLVYDCNHGTCIYPNPGNGSDVEATLYIYNNIVFNSRIPNIQVDMWGQKKASSSVLIYNNTLHCPGGNCIRIVPPQSGNIALTNLVVQNNHYISDGYLVECWNGAEGNRSCGPVTKAVTASHNVLSRVAQAAADGYTIESRFSPANSNGPTVDAGTIPAHLGLFDTDSHGKSRPQLRTWDAGAYEFDGPVLPAKPAAPTDVSATLQ